MNDLHTVQVRLAQAMLADTPPQLDHLRGDAMADVASRLAIYHHGYRIRLRDALRTEFPGLALMAGRHFQPLLDSFVAAHPSTHYNIRWHGEGLAAFLAEVPPWRERPELAEMAQLDWSISTAFDAADQSAVDATELARVPPEAWAVLRLHPLRHVRILTCTCNVDAFRRAADRGLARPALRRLRQPRHLLVWRPGLDVRFRRVEADELPALDGALGGEPFARLCERLAERHAPATALPRMAALLHRWLNEGLIGRLGLPAQVPM